MSYQYSLHRVLISTVVSTFTAFILKNWGVIFIKESSYVCNVSVLCVVIDACSHTMMKFVLSI